jgi:hypothetical protein
MSLSYLSFSFSSNKAVLFSADTFHNTDTHSWLTQAADFLGDELKWRIGRRRERGPEVERMGEQGKGWRSGGNKVDSLD